MHANRLQIAADPMSSSCNAATAATAATATTAAEQERRDKRLPKPNLSKVSGLVKPRPRYAKIATTTSTSKNRYYLSI